MGVNAVAFGVGAAVVVGVGVLAYVKRDTIKKALDVTSQDNIVSGPTNAIISSFTEIEDDTLGATLQRKVRSVSRWFGDIFSSPSDQDILEATRICNATNSSTADVDACIATVSEKIRAAR